MEGQSCRFRHDYFFRGKIDAMWQSPLDGPAPLPPPRLLQVGAARKFVPRLCLFCLRALFLSVLCLCLFVSVNIKCFDFERIKLQAPEMIKNEHYDSKIDVYSYGICLWELYTRRVPYVFIIIITHVIVMIMCFCILFYILFIYLLVLCLFFKLCCGYN